MSSFGGSGGGLCGWFCSLLHSGIFRPQLPTAGIADTCRTSGCVLCASISKGFGLGVLFCFLRLFKGKKKKDRKEQADDVILDCGFSIFYSPELAPFSVSGAMQNWRGLVPHSPRN